MKNVVLGAIFTLAMVAFTGCATSEDTNVGAKCSTSKCSTGKKCASATKCSGDKAKAMATKCSAGKCGK